MSWLKTLKSIVTRVKVTLKLKKQKCNLSSNSFNITQLHYLIKIVMIGMNKKKNNQFFSPSTEKKLAALWAF